MLPYCDVIMYDLFYYIVIIYYISYNQVESNCWLSSNKLVTWSQIMFDTIIISVNEDNDWIKVME